MCTVNAHLKCKLVSLLSTQFTICLGENISHSLIPLQPFLVSREENKIFTTEEKKTDE